MNIPCIILPQPDDVFSMGEDQKAIDPTHSVGDSDSVVEASLPPSKLPLCHRITTLKIILAVTS